MGGEDRPVLDPGQHRLDELPVDRPVPERLAEPAHGALQRALLTGGQLLVAVQLLGDVDELEVCGEGAGEHDRRGVVDLGEQAVEGVVAGLPGGSADLLDQGEELRSLVPRQRLAQQLAELAHRGPQRRVLRVGRHSPAEPGDVERAALGLAVALGQHTGVGSLAGGHVRQSDRVV